MTNIPGEPCACEARCWICLLDETEESAMNPYPAETLDEDDDDGTMPDNVAALSDAVIGHRIVSVHGEDVPSRYYDLEHATVITLDNGKRVELVDTHDCCAYTALEVFLLHPERVGHVITGVGTTDGFTKWHIFADYGDVLELTVGWSAGNPFYYGYGFDITVKDLPTDTRRPPPTTRPPARSDP